MASRGVRLQGLVQKLGRDEVLHGIDLDIGAGVFGILGPNGAGKTTVLRTLATVIKPSDGAVQILGFDPNNAKERRLARRKLGYLPQTFGYYPNFTVSEFVEYFALLKEMPHERIESAVAKAIERVDLSGHADSKLRTLSGGMLRRAGIAQAIVNEPELLLLDEPTAGLDPEQRVAFRALVRQFAESATVILSTHLVEDVGATCTHIAVLDRGSVVFLGTPSGLDRIGQTQDRVGDSPLERGYSAVITGGQQ